jgi:hypothetical protein
MTRKKAFKRRETKVSYCEVTPHAVWPLAKSLMRRYRPKSPSAIHGPSGLYFLPVEKTNTIADCLENQFTPCVLCEENHERRVEAQVQALFEAVDNSPPEKARPCGAQNQSTLSN